MATYDLATQSAPSLTAVQAGDIINCSYCGSTKSITLPPGQYKLECWGAQGGGYSSFNLGGKGGYSIGTLTLTTNTTLYMASGGQGLFQSLTPQVNDGGWNGGGQSYSGDNGGRGSGGGGSDIRIGTDHNVYRIIVAGGGGGNLYWNDSSLYTAGAGGGISGFAGRDTSNTSTGKGGTSTAGGDGDLGGCDGDFGQGGDVTSINTACGGGGGWYGGGAGNPAGGGSGYVYTESTYSNHPYNSAWGSTYYLSDANTYAGNTSFTAPGGSNETGHSGDGYTRITVMSLDSMKIYLKTDPLTWKQIG